MKSVKIVMTTSILTAVFCLLSLSINAQSNSFTFSKKEGNENFKLLKIDINSKTSENDLASYIADAKKEKVDLSFTRIKRDAKGNLISISAVYKTKDNKTETYTELDKIAIDPFYFYVTTSEKSKVIEKIGFRINNNATMDNVLFVVNGQEVPKPFDVGMINPEHIEAINVLKNESARAKYGARAKNGVIEITLK
ncbi:MULTISPECIES: TonB-dependent receptor plug domain-containing protein [unclassified Cellulophaga]|uniref:TonB-dependent receptor plug domain-containing protein n=1 Tax=unclassified Cellulophaga TaxID=2634405 RepID=UPI0026E1E5C0|nr:MULTISPECIES: TonB-dependent receptor plug domain-containing protein [unclassified Cellulophaga]MDO6489967.1 TonB-dependent receptor plug domain-containing protein [Cellulophaga sp. 2_MG-2023]MDO6494839.1 TonB-dependent receptor plug domain-containing protein [Cellulophaga sp. 3_MG-2023]